MGSIRCAFDIETRNWWTAHPIDCLHAIVSDDGDYVLSLFPMSAKTVSSKGRVAQYLEFGKGGPDLDEQRKQSVYLTNASARILRGMDVRITQNGLSYDFPRCANEEGVFTLGSDGSEPRKSQFRRSMSDRSLRVSTDAEDFDIVWFARSYLGAFLPDYKLETIANFTAKFLGVDCSFKKMQSYEDQNRLVERCDKGDEEAARLFAEYNYDDAIITKVVGETYLPTLENIARMLRIPFFDAFHDTPDSVALLSSEREEWNGLHREKDYRDHDRIDETVNPVEHFRRIIDTKLGWQPVQGKVSDVLVVYAPVADCLPNGSLVADLAHGASPLEAYIYHQVAQGQLRDLLIDLTLVKERPTYAKVVQAKHGLSYPEIRQRMFDGLDTIVSGFRDVQVVNRYRNLFFVQGMTEDTARRRGFIPFGMATALSLDKESVAYRLQGELCSAGIAVPSEKKCSMTPGSNEKCAFELKLVHNLVNLAFQDPMAALQYVREERKRLHSGIPDDQLLRRVRKKREPEHMGVNQQRGKRGSVIQAFEAEIGESIIYLYGREKQFMRYHPAIDERDGGTIDIDEYSYEIFGKKSTAFNILKAVLKIDARELSDKLDVS